MKQGEDDLGVASGVRRVLEDRKIGLVIEDLVEDIGRVTNRRRGVMTFDPYCDYWSEVQV